MLDSWRATWSTICGHCDGMALAPVMDALGRAGVLHLLLSEPGACLGRIVEEVGGHRGSLHVALRALASQGWVLREGEPATDEMRFHLTEEGRAVLALAGAYRHAPALLRAAAGGRPPQDLLELSRRRWELPDSSAGRRIALHLDGFLAGPEVLRVRHGEGGDLPFLEALGWAEPGGGLTVLGRGASKMGVPYGLPLSYLPLLGDVGAILFGDSAIFDPAAPEREGHIDRAGDIRFSGELSEGLCVRAALPGLKLRFGGEPLEAQPAFLADTGCGDGGLLAGLCEAIRTDTARGRHLDRFPLAAVALDEQPVSREAARRRLAQSGLPHVVLPGDIRDPGGIAGALAGAGFRMEEGLHLSKSVLHDRSWREPRDREAARRRRPRSTGAFVDEAGEAIPNGFLEQDLVETLADWGPWVRRHGMLLFEGHTVAPDVAAAHRATSWVTAFDVLQGLSRQYPVEVEVLHQAAREAGYRIEASVDVDGGICGHPFLTMTWLRWG